MDTAQTNPMMTALFIWMGLSVVATAGILSALALGARRQIPAEITDASTEGMTILNRGAAGDAKFSPSFAR